jgi:hypothetical protein
MRFGAKHLLIEIAGETHLLFPTKRRADNSKRRNKKVVATGAGMHL